MTPDPLRILCLGDGRPGHEKQTLAMVEAFSGKTPVEERWFQIPRRRSFAFFSLSAGVATCFLPGLSGRFLKKYGWADEHFVPDLIMATGSHTHGLLLLFGEHYKAKTLVCMTPDIGIRSRIDLVLSPMHDGLKQKSNIWLTLGPPCRQITPKNRQEGQGLILVGGVDASSHEWQNEKLMGQIEKLAQKKNISSWLVGSSPRTPEETENSLQILSGKIPHLSFVPYSGTRKGWVEEAYASSTEAWITADSVSMVYEALTAGCRVGVLPVLWQKKRNKFQKSLDILHGAGWIRYPDEKDKNRKLPVFDEAGRAAEEALKRWWGKN